MAVKVKCLVVDDLQENLLAMSALLKNDDVEVLTASSGADALELLLQHDVALALLDVQMPDMDGFHLAELMRGSERTRHIPIIFVTAGARDQWRTFKGYEAGAVDFLYKPVEAHVLRNKADVFFQLHRQKLQLMQELADRSERLRFNEMFTAVLGHDLRNPLHAILLSAEVLMRMPGNSAVAQTAARIQSSSKRMQRMIEDLLDLTRLRLADGLSLKREVIDFGQVVGSVIAEYQAAHPDRTLEVLREGDLSGTWDADRLAQVASNLVGNALTHGDPSAGVTIALRGTDPATIEMAVSNQGVIAPDLLPVIFDPFRGRDRNARRGGGLGLGLYIAQQIVVAHGGTIDVRSTAAQGTTFTVRIPRGS
ncbi:MAG TPA: hybrid sensor histidine kinase/response regulator [Nevskiaceae bacterium]|nr:hybrid sensor histidine kinase/response regulator [Nevskiaceae bacterium]